MNRRRNNRALDEQASFAGWLSNAFVTSRLTVAFMLACALVGAWSLWETPRQDNPRIVVPAARVSVALPGASPAEVEALVVRPLEAVIRQVAGVDEVYATAAASGALLYVTFETSESEEDALLRLYDRIGARRDLLPEDAGAPVIRSIDSDDVPIVTLTLVSATLDDFALKRVADRLADGLRTVPGASGVEVHGGRDREVRIELDPDRMQAFAVTLDQLRSRLAAGNVAAPVGAAAVDGQRTELQLDNRVVSVGEVRDMVVGVHAGRPVRLGDVAAVIDDAPAERSRLSRLAFGPADARFGRDHDAELPAVTVAVAKTAEANAVVVSREVLARVERMRETLLPGDVEVVVTRDDGAFADDTINGLIQHLLVAIVAVFFVVTAFLGLRQALIVGLGIPLVLALTLGMVWLAGYSINRVTLFGLILSLGLLVDDAIVVIENVHRHLALDGGRDRRAAIVRATREIGNATNLATLAVMVVFLSLMAIPGMVGQFFYPVAYAVPVAMASSLIVAYTVVPWAAMRWLPDETAHATSAKPIAPESTPAQHGTLAARFRRVLAPLVDNPQRQRHLARLVLAALALSLLMPAWQYLRPAGVNAPIAWFGVETGMMPGDDKNTFNVILALPEDAPVEDTDRVARRLGEVLRSHPEVRDYQLWLGRSGIIDFNGMLRGTGDREGEHYAELRVNLRDKKIRDATSHAVVRDLRPRLQAVVAEVRGATVQVVEDPPGPPVRGNILAEIYSPDEAQRRAASAAVAAVFAGTRNVVETLDTEPADAPRLRFVVDRDKAALAGVTVAEVATALRRLVDGEALGRAHLDGELNPVPIRLLVPRRHQVDPAQLTRAFVSNDRGVRVPLSTLVSIERSLVERPVQRRNGERVTFVSGEPGESPPVYAVLDMNERLDGLRLPDGSTLRTGNLGLFEEIPDTTQGPRLHWGGQQRQMLDTYRDMGRSLGIAMVLLYLILVAYYRSFSLPAVALLAVPLGLIGVFPGHWLLGQQISATSIVGVIALAGIVVRNSLLIIDFVLEYRRQGRPLREAVIEAGAIRLRPILLTALAIMLGSAVMLADPMFIGLAISLIFGTLAATALTLLCLPLALYHIVAWRERRDGLA